MLCTRRLESQHQQGMSRKINFLLYGFSFFCCVCSLSIAGYSPESPVSSKEKKFSRFFLSFCLHSPSSASPPLYHHHHPEAITFLLLPATFQPWFSFTKLFLVVYIVQAHTTSSARKTNGRCVVKILCAYSRCCWWWSQSCQLKLFFSFTQCNPGLSQAIIAAAPRRILTLKEEEEVGRKLIASRSLARLVRLFLCLISRSCPLINFSPFLKITSLMSLNSGRAAAICCWKLQFSSSSWATFPILT